MDTAPAVPIAGGDGSDLNLSPNAVAQVQAVYADKLQWTPVQQKLDSHLIYAIRKVQNLSMVPGRADITFQDVAPVDAAGQVNVTIKGVITPAILTAVINAGGTVLGSYPQFGALDARLPITKVETVAALPDVRTITTASTAITKKGPPLDVVTEGDPDHQADVFRSLTGVTGANFAGIGRPIKIGILSDGLANDATAGNKLAKSIASGNLAGIGTGPGKVIILQDGPASVGGIPGNSGEGVAMLEIVRDLLPNAQLYFATAYNTINNFAANILALQAVGCDIIIDDIGYRDEAPFQNDVLAQATNTVAGKGALFFSAAGNEGNLTAGTGAVWEGDFSNGGRINIGVNPTAPFGSIIVHRYANGTPYNSITNPGFQSVLDWSDPLAKSNNDYDIFVTTADGTSVVGMSNSTQNGTQDPHEFVVTTNGQRVYIAATLAAATRVPPLPPNPIPPAQRALRLHAYGSNGNSQAYTFVTNGNVYGHSAAVGAYSVSATPATLNNLSFPVVFTGSSQTERFTVDGPRRLFFNDDGSPITPAFNPLFTTGAGTLLNKTDITAADGVTTGVVGFIPFFGTSAAAPHAGAIAGLVKAYTGMQGSTMIVGTKLTSAEIFTTLAGSAIDIGAPGYDNVAGYGIVMPVNALNYLTNFATTVSITNLTATSVTVRFNTNLPADATVQVIPDALYQSSGGSLAGATTFTSPIIGLTHTVVVTGLQPGTKYDYFVSSKTASGSVVYNDPATLRMFTTPGVVIPPPPSNAGGIIVGKASAVRSGPDVIVTVSLTNNTANVANAITITSAKLNGTATTTKLPFLVGSGLYPGATLPAPVRFVYPAGATGTTASVTVTGTSSVGSFTGTATVKLP